VIIARYTLIILIFTRASLDLLLGQASLGEGGLTLGAGLNVVMLALGLAALVSGYRPSLRIPALIWAPYLIIAVLSLSYTPDFSGGIRLFLSTLTFPAMFVSAFALLKSENDMIVFLRAIVYSSAIPVIYGIIQIVSGAAPDFRVNATFGHANIFAFYIVAVLVAILYHNIFVANATSVIWRYGSRIYLIVLLALLVATQTRSAWIEVAFISAAYAITVNRKLLLALPVVPLVLMVPQVSERLTDLDTGNRASIEQVTRGEVALNSYAWRRMLWDSALADSANARMLGKGLGSFHHNVRYFFPLTQSEGEAHSGYIQAIYELGTAGLIGYTWLYFGILVAAWRLRRASGALSCLVMAFVVGNLIINYSDNLPYYLAYNWYAWALVGADLSWRLRKLRKTQPQTIRPTIGDASASYPDGAGASPAVRLRARPAAGSAWSSAE